MLSERRFFFLQGHATPFYLRLGKALAEAGHGVSRVNTCGGDRTFWGNWHARDFRGRAQELGAFVAEAMSRDGATDLVVYNDCRPCNATAITEARRLGMTVHVFEEGYLRPNWLTLERGGINGNTRLPDDPVWYRETAASLPAFDMGEPVGAGLRERILFDFRWQAANYLHHLHFPHYRTHRPYPIWAEYTTWALRLAVLKRRGAEARTVVSELCRSGERFFLFPLQLDSDSQIRVHSPYGRLQAAIEAVIEDFAAHAARNSRLVIKNHPLDNGWINLRRVVERSAKAAAIGDQVTFIDGGDLNALIDHAAGTVTINSTVGLTALHRGRPVIALGKAVFDIPGLTFQGSLAEFWHDPGKPDAALLDAYRRVVLHGCLVNGNFYTEQGMRLGIANSVARLTAATDLLDDAPPRSTRGTPQPAPQLAESVSA